MTTNNNKNKSTLVLMIAVFVLPVVLAYLALQNDWFNKVEEAYGAFLLQKSNLDVNEVFKNTDLNAIFISDTLHNIVLRYPTTSDIDEATMDSRNILADLKKLLKLSRIG